jgi:DDE superfamily endonuclease
VAEGAAGPSRSRPRGPGPLQKKFPALIEAIGRDHPEAERLEIWFLDEARVGQTGRVCRRWFERGLRPRGVRDLRHEAVYLFGAVCPERDARVALALPTVSAGAHAVVLMDRAGWHIAKELALPANLTPVFLPPYSPELNAIERVWLYLRERFLSQRLWPGYDDILDACCLAWNALLAETGRIRSLCALDWTAPVSS